MAGPTVTVLNPGVGGDAMNERAVDFTTGVTPRKHPVVTLSGDADDAADVVLPINSAPSGTEYALPTRQVGAIIANIGTVGSLALDATLAAGVGTLNTSLGSIFTRLGDGSVHVIVDAISLPGGLATTVKQDTGNTSLASIDSKLTNPLPVSVVTLPLPALASTAALQTTGNASLASIDTKLTSPLVVTGTVTANLGTVDGLALDATLGAGVSLLDGDLAAIFARLANGTQHAIVDNFPATQAVSGTVTANLGTIAGAATEVTLATRAAASQLPDALVDGKLSTVDDFTTWESQHLTLVASTSTAITLPAGTRMVRVQNWDTSNRVLVKASAISSDTDAAASRVGKAPTTDVANEGSFPAKVTTVYLRSAVAAEVTVEAFR